MAPLLGRRPRAPCYTRAWLLYRAQLVRGPLESEAFSRRTRPRVVAGLVLASMRVALLFPRGLAHKPFACSKTALAQRTLEQRFGSCGQVNITGQRDRQIIEVLSTDPITLAAANLFDLAATWR